MKAIRSSTLGVLYMSHHEVLVTNWQAGWRFIVLVMEKSLSTYSARCRTPQYIEATPRSLTPESRGHKIMDAKTPVAAHHHRLGQGEIQLSTPDLVPHTILYIYYLRSTPCVDSKSEEKLTYRQTVYYTILLSICPTHTKSQPVPNLRILTGSHTDLG